MAPRETPSRLEDFLAAGALDWPWLAIVAVPPVAALWLLHHAVCKAWWFVEPHWHRAPGPEPARFPVSLVGGLRFRRAALADRSRGWRARVEAAEVLAREAPHLLVEAAEAILDDPHEPLPLQTRLLEALGATRHPKVPRLLVTALRHRDVQCFIVARLMLRRLAERPEERAAVADALCAYIARSKLPWNYLPALRELAALCGRIPDPERTLKVRRLLEGVVCRPPSDPYSEEAAAAASEALGRLQERAAVPVLLEAAKSDSDMVRLKAVDALGLLGAREAVDWLSYLAAHDWVGRIRKAAVRSLLAIRRGEALARRSLPLAV